MKKSPMETQAIMDEDSDLERLEEEGSEAFFEVSKSKDRSAYKSH